MRVSAHRPASSPSVPARSGVRSEHGSHWQVADSNTLVVSRRYSLARGDGSLAPVRNVQRYADQHTDGNHVRKSCKTVLVRRRGVSADTSDSCSSWAGCEAFA